MSSSEEEELSGEGWIPWFCAMKGHEFFAEVDDDYIRDTFNLYGLRNRVQYYDLALEMLLSSEIPDDDDLTDNEFLEIYRNATDLYALVHARYIISPRGLQLMKDKFAHGHFGTCPRYNCERQLVIPVGTSDDLHHGRVMVFCPKCEQLYAPRRSRHTKNDGCFFGTSFPHIFLQTFPALIPIDSPRPFKAKLFGFGMHGKKSILERKLKEPAVNDDHAINIETRTMPLTSFVEPSADA